MEPDLTPTAINWTDLTGTILPGGYELKELLEADDAEAQFRARVLGDREVDAVAQFIQASPEETERQVSSWELMRELRSPNLTTPLGAGSWDRNGIELGYVVLRRADESLNGVLRERALTPAETTDVVLSIAKGLEALHVNGLVHGALSPEQVVAVGDRIQLSVTGIRRSHAEPEIALVLPKYLAPESEYADEEDDGENLTPESDIWCLGATVFEALTQKDWSEDSREETAALPEPFATIALRCLEEKPEGRCKLPEAIALLKGELKPAPRAKAAAAAASAVATTTTAPVSVVPAPKPAEAKAPGTNGVAPALTGSAVPVTRNLASAPAPLKLANQPAAIPPAAAPPPAKPKIVPSAAARPSPKPIGPPPAKSLKAQMAAKAASQPAAAQPTMVRNSSSSAKSSRPPMRLEYALASASGISRRWIWVGAGLLFVIVLIWALRPRTDSSSSVVGKAVSTKPSVPVTQEPAPKNPDVTAPTGETKVLRPDGTASKEAASPAVAAPVPAAAPPVASKSLGTSAHGDVWHVILYTYARREDAERMTQNLNKRHAGLQAEVFSREADQGPYLVTAGSGMTKGEANDARRKAVGQGLPRDTYIQNFPH